MSQIITDLLRYRISIATQEGIVPADILSLAGVDPQLMSSEQEYYDRAVELKIWEAIVTLTEREDIGLVCGQQFPTQVISVIGYVMVNSPTLGVAIQKVCDYQKLLGDSMGMRLELGENTATLHIDLWDEWFDALRYTVDMMISVASSWTANNTLGSVRALSVGFHYQRPQNTKPYLDLFAPAPVLFGCESSHLVFSADAMDTPILGANTAMFIAFEEKVKQVIADFEGQHTYTYKVQHEILRSLKGTVPNVNDISKTLAVSVRKLQQNLKKEGTTYSKLLGQARRDLAISYLREKQISQTELAYLLGFSEVSVFSRSFKKWTGFSPSEYIINNP